MAQFCDLCGSVQEQMAQFCDLCGSVEEQMAEFLVYVVQYGNKWQSFVNTVMNFRIL